MSDNNISLGMYDDEIAADEKPLTQDEILMSESDILSGLLDLGKTKNETENYRKIQIRRDGALKLEFRVRPITEDESQICLKNSNRYAVTKPGQPKRVLESDGAKFRSWLIYTATVDEDRAKVWENRAAQSALGALQGVDMVDKVLLAGEKGRVLDIIDEISGFNDEAEQAAGNS